MATHGKPKLALKVDVDTLRGTREGVPRLAEILHAQGAGATFLFSLGPDHTGRAIRRVFRPGFMNKVSRTSVFTHYGIRTLLYGTLLPGPDIARQCGAIMREVRAAGFETGVHTYDHVKWQDHVASKDADWTEREMRRAYDRFVEVFGVEPRAHGAAGWQTNVHALRLTQRMGFDYCSDTRGTSPFIPVVDAEIIDCPQLPTTLPTLDELIGMPGTTEVAGSLLRMSASPPPAGHVYTLHAELEGMKLAATLKTLLAGWKDQGYELVSLRTYFGSLDRRQLPRHEVLRGEMPGRSGTVAIQGEEFLVRARRS